jgi:hypothetical protein
MTTILALLAFAQASPDYVWQKPVPRNVDPAANDLRARLEKEVKRLLALGHPKPAYYRVGISQGYMLYGYGGETLYTLADVLPLLSPETQQAVRSYLVGERSLQGRRPLQDGLYHGTAGWGNNPLDGLRREYHPIPPGYLINVWPAPPVQPEAIYMIWRYGDATGDWTWVDGNWTAITNLYDAIGTVDRYGKIAALIGMARMAQRRGEAATADAAATAAQNALAGSDWNAYLNSANARSGLDTHDWAYPIFHYFRQRNALAGVLSSPEVGRYLKDAKLASVQASVDPKIGRAPGDHASATVPAWFQFRSDYPYGEFGKWGPQNFQGGENAFHTPDLALTFFMIRAHVYQESGATLREFVDFATCVGDLYHLQKLAAAIRAYGTTAWVDSRTAPNATPVATISSPADGASLGSSVTLQGSATDAEDGALAGTRLTWVSDRQGVLGTGTSLATTLAAGVHVVTLQATDSTGNAGYDQIVLTITASGGGGTAPAAPTNLAATAVSPTQIDLSWTDGSNNETGFRIERKTGAAGTWAEIATVGAGATAYADTSVAASTTYVYRVRATNATGDSGYSDEATATTPALPPVLPTLSVSSTDADASEPGTDTARLTITRSGSTASPLTVFFAVTGSATAGADYGSLGTSVVIPAGQASAALAVNPIDDPSDEPDETVVVTLQADATYSIGTASATATIADDDAPGALPPPWVHGDVGSTGLGGDASGSFTVLGAGADIWGAADAFHFVHQGLVGDGQILARVVSQTNSDPWAKAGVMIRESTAAGSIHAMMVVTPGNGSAFQRRLATGGQSFTTPGGPAPLPQWVRLRRVGDTITAYTSADGVAWTLVVTENLVMAAGVRIGLAVTSHNAAALSTVVFDNVFVLPGTDTDGDGMGDAGETLAGFDPGSADQDGNGRMDGADDWDGDGTPNFVELANGTPAGSPPGTPAAPGGGSGGGGCGLTGLPVLLLFLRRRR